MPLRSWPIRLLRGARSRDGSRSIRPAPETISLVTRRAQPAAATVARLTITAVVAFVVARLVTDTAYPVIAPLTAMLVVQVTLYRTFWSALQRVASVVAGVLVALGLSHALGLTWWSLGITVAAALIIGMVLRLGDSMLEVPISAMLILSLGSEELAAARVLETFIGAATGLASGLLFAPLRVQPAEEAIDELGARLGSLLDQMSAELTKEPSRDRSNEWLARARQLTDELDEVEDALGRRRRAYGSIRAAHSLSTRASTCAGAWSRWAT
ncbi:MAG TPA: FUSC family protein [Micromonosporaceae bacterium]|nr:FUSC family protein [Micromonosporaceae bacterium]